MVREKEHDACMAIMVRINVNEMADMKKDFDAHEGGLNLEQFVATMLRRLEWDPENVISLTQDLIELFAQIDINDDKSMEWDEFTSFVIQAGMSESENQKAQFADLRYQEDTTFEENFTKQPQKIRYIPELKKLFVNMGNTPVIQVFDPSSLLMTGQDEGAKTLLSYPQEIHPLSYIAGYRSAKDEFRSDRSPVQAIKYLTGLDVLAISAGDLHLSFWNASTVLTREKPSPLFLFPTKFPQKELEWCQETSTLYSIDNTFFIHAWKVSLESSDVSVYPIAKLAKHTDIIQDILLVNPSTLVSCGMDAQILLWDTRTNEYRSSRNGHQRGVRCLEKSTDMTFLSAGFEYDILAWDLSGLTSLPIFRLLGHTSAILSVKKIPNVKEAVSVDDDGWFRWWNLQDEVSMEDSERCLQTFRMGNNDEHRWKCNSMIPLHGGKHLVAAGVKLKLITRMRERMKCVASCAVWYNSVSFTILTTTDKDINIWDAVTGELLRTYHNLSSTEITGVELDTRQRKFFVINQAGEILVFDYLNGARMKTFLPHNAEATGIVYCREDKCIITTSWDKSLRVYDDDRTNSLLRCVSHAHEQDIASLAFSYPLGLIATGSGGHIKLWDFVFFSIDSVCSLSSSEVTVLLFVDPYPLLLSGHQDGKISFWPVRPWVIGQATPVEPLHSFANHAWHEVSITSMVLHYDESSGEEITPGIRRGRFLVFTATSNGVVTCWDITKSFRSMNMNAVRQDHLPSKSRGYNPKRNIFRDGRKSDKVITKKENLPGRHKLTKSLGGSRKLVKDDDIVKVVQWTAHDKRICNMHIVTSPLSLLTCSADNSIRLWSLTGQLMGQLSTVKGDEHPTWQLKPNIALARESKKREAERLFEKLSSQVIVNGVKVDQKSESGEETKPSERLTKSATTPNLFKDTLVSKKGEKPFVEQQRIFDQLSGKETWKKSMLEIAQEKAMAKQIQKLDQRMKKLSASLRNKTKRTKKGMENYSHPTDGAQAQAQGRDDNILSPFHTVSGHNMEMLAPLEINRRNVTQLPFDDQDNWAVDSLNRRKQLYQNLHVELLHGNRSGKSSAAKQREQMDAMDLSPSDFLFQKLGKDSVVALTSSQSVPLLVTGEKEDSKPLAEKKSKSTTMRAKTFKRRKASFHNLLPPLQAAETIEQRMRRVSLSLDKKADCLSPEVRGRASTSTQASRMLHELIQRSSQSALESEEETTLTSTAFVNHAKAVAKQSNQEEEEVTDEGHGEGGSKSTTSKKKGGRNDARILNKTHFGAYSREEVLDVYRLFCRIDKNSSGTIDLAELVSSKEMMNDTWIKDHIHGIFSSLDKDSSGQIEIAELFEVLFPNASQSTVQDMSSFVDILRKAERGQIKKKRILSPRTLNEITELFHLYDTDGSGSIDAAELIGALHLNSQYYGESKLAKEGRLDVPDIVATLQEYDKNGNSTLELPEFIELFRDVF